MPKKPSPAEQAIAQMRRRLQHPRRKSPGIWISSDAYHAADKPRKPTTGTTIAVKCGREAPQEAPESKVSPDSTSDSTKMCGSDKTPPP